MPFQLPKKHNQGQILLSILVAMAIFLILAHALFTLVASSFELVSFNKARIAARHLANEKIENIKNLPYENVGLVGGIPEGVIEPNEIISINDLSYEVKTDIFYVDDEFDGNAPLDTSPEDYKRVRIEVSWNGIAPSNKNPVILITDITSNLFSSTEGGTLKIFVVNANGDPISQADVNIYSDDVDPIYSYSTKTDNDGIVSRPGLTECIECYEITVSKEGYSEDRTHSTSEVANPSKPHVSIFEDDVTQTNFTIDTLGNINISSKNSRDNLFTDLGNVSFRIHSNKIIGTDTLAQPVYKYDEILATDASGNLNLNDIEWGVYYIEMSPLTSHDISGTSPNLPLYLAPSDTLNFEFATETHSNHSLFLTVKDPGQNLIASSSAHLTETSSGYDETGYTGGEDDPDFGQVLFSNLEELTYTLYATASGFLNYSGDYDVSGITNAVVILTPE